MPTPYVNSIASDTLFEQAERKGYQQALIDFGIVDLIDKIGDYSDAISMEMEPEECESVAALFVQQLSENLTPTHVIDSLNSLRHSGDDIVGNPIHLEIIPSSSNLTPNFTEAIPPRYSEGSCVRWKTLSANREWGVVIGRFYAFAPHQCGWGWRYIVRLDSDSPSAAWVCADTAWEDDLEEEAI